MDNFTTIKKNEKIELKMRGKNVLEFCGWEEKNPDIV